MAAYLHFIAKSSASSVSTPKNKHHTCQLLVTLRSVAPNCVSSLTLYLVKMLDPTDPEAYTIGWLCALPTESIAAQVVLDEEFEPVNIAASQDTNSYQYGRIKDHYVVIAILPSGYRKVNAATVGTNMLRSFRNVRIGLTVGIGGGAPSPKDIRLGDVVVGTPQGEHSGILQHDFGKSIQGMGFQRMGRLNNPPQALLTVVSNLQTNHARQGNGLKQAVEHLLEKNPGMKESFTRPDSETDIPSEAILSRRVASLTLNSSSPDAMVP